MYRLFVIADHMKNWNQQHETIESAMKGARNMERAGYCVYIKNDIDQTIYITGGEV